MADARAASRCWPLTELRIQGLHNAANALAALASGEALALPLRGDARRSCASFAGLPHRSQWVADVRGVRYVNDSKGTNVGATLAAVAGMAGPLVLILGGDGKSRTSRRWRAALRGKVRHAVLIGRDAAAHRAGARRGVRAGARARRCRRRCAPRRARRSPVTPCCCRRPAPASTCSVTTPIAARCSPQAVRGAGRMSASRSLMGLRAPAHARRGAAGPGDCLHCWR